MGQKFTGQGGHGTGEAGTGGRNQRINAQAFPNAMGTCLIRLYEHLLVKGQKRVCDYPDFSFVRSAHAINRTNTLQRSGGDSRF